MKTFEEIVVEFVESGKVPIMFTVIAVEAPFQGKNDRGSYTIYKAWGKIAGKVMSISSASELPPEAATVVANVTSMTYDKGVTKVKIDSWERVSQ